MLRTQLCCLLKRTMSTNLTEHQKALMKRSLPKRAPLPNVNNILVVASGKGGVGKSTIAVNLAVTFAAMGKRVGLLDADIFGPSIPMMMKINEEPLVNEENQMIPPLNYGVKCLSMGILAQHGDAIIWRGPLVMSALQRLLKGAIWGPLDILIVDTPPGTGDVHLSLTQNVPINGVLLVSTPQAVALEVTLRGAQMYRTLDVPILGLVENMGHIICSKCTNRMEIFQNATERFLKDLQTKRLLSIPLSEEITQCCDMGVPIVSKNNESECAKSFHKLAEQLWQQLMKKNYIKRKVERNKTKGAGWYNLPATEVTEDVKNDLMILQMRSALDPKHFYKKNDLKVLPKYFQIGTVQHSSLYHYDERNSRRNKERSLVEELMADEAVQKYIKRKYQEVITRNDKYAHRRALKKMKKLKNNK